jgi:hypothetical protein
MTVKELLSKKKTIFLFMQHGWTYYACGDKFYKVFQDVIFPAEKEA